MKRSLALLALVALLAVPALAEQQYTIWSDQGTNAQTTLSTSGSYTEAQITVWASTGSPDGTVTIYYISPSGQWVVLKTYATPTAAKTFRGPVGASLGFSLTGNTTGKVSISAVLK